jgi:hypothetical protein
MATDSDVERVLRDELHARAVSERLPERVLTDSLALGRRAVRRRRRQAVTGTAAGLALVVGLVAATGRGGDDGPEPAPAITTPTTTPTPTEPAAVAPGAWANSLPAGAPPEVPYLAGTTVIQPDGTRVETGGTGVGVIGLTVAGLVLLVENEVEEQGQPYSFTSRYVLVTNDGEVRDLPASTLVEDSAQGAVVSPDGTRFTSGAEILDVRDLSVVGQVPDAADVLVAWLPAGILYSAGRRSYVWPEGGKPREVAAYPGVFPNGTDVGIDDCGVVWLTTSVSTPLSECRDDLRSVSPTGRWSLTNDLRLVEIATGDSRYLAGGPVRPVPDANDKVHWDGDGTLLFPVGALLVRCDAATAMCERATDGHELKDGRLALP